VGHAAGFGLQRDFVLYPYRIQASTTNRSICSGAFILADAGLLDGRRATTHWARAAELTHGYPQIRVEPDRIYVRDGKLWSSAGITAGIDLALALVADDLGEDVAKRTAQQLVVYYRRPGGQSQFSALLDIDRPDSRFSALLAWHVSALGSDFRWSDSPNAPQLAPATLRGFSSPNWE
jgi:transcriptional regulator GlxA family with amidase domain